MSEEMKELQENIVLLRIEVARLGEKVDSIRSLSDKVTNHESRLSSVEEKTASAHKRLDTIDNNAKWLWRTIGSVFILGVVGVTVAYMASTAKGVLP